MEFTEDIQIQDKITEIEAQSYQVWIDQHIPVSAGTYSNPAEAMKNNECQFFGDWVFYRQEFVAVDSHTGFKNYLPLVYQGKQTAVSFTGNLSLPTLDNLNGEIIRPFEPQRAINLLPVVQQAQGRIFAAGASSGWVLNRLIEKPEVTGLTIVDADKSLLDRFGAPLVHRGSKLGKVVRLVEGNPWGFLEMDNLSLYQGFFFNVWKRFGEAAADLNLRGFKRVASQHDVRVWAWGDDLGFSDLTDGDRYRAAEGMPTVEDEKNYLDRLFEAS